jgi:HD superfamily phosphodiesterase
MRILPEVFRFVSLTQRLYNIDESHGITHSMDVFLKADEIYRHEVSNYPYLEKQKHIIDTAAIIHDMCDTKYMNKVEGISRIRYFLNDKLPLDDIDAVTDIISKMSYSYVREFGYPNLKKYQMAYHIVREADLLAAYNIDRSIIYDMEVNKLELNIAFKNSEHLFERRMGKYREDNLFITDYSKSLSTVLEKECIERIDSWKRAIKEK